MKIADHHLACAHLWLFNSGVDPSCVNVDGRSLVESLAAQFARFEHDGKVAASASRIAVVTTSGVFPRHNDATDEDTGKYNVKELTTLLKECL